MIKFIQSFIQTRLGSGIVLFLVFFLSGSDLLAEEITDGCDYEEVDEVKVTTPKGI